MNNLEKEFLPYEEALELKQLGFDEPVLRWWTKNKNLTGYNGSEGFPRLKAPTFSQAFRWFREKYRISPSIHCMSEQGNSWRYHIPNEGGENNFSTYEEAEFACLCKLIEIVKSKQ